MPTVVTDPPILIDAVTYSRQSNAEINPMFFPPIGSKFYQGLARNINGGGQLVNAANIFKSTDTAATWAIEDVADSPGHHDSYFSFNPTSGIVQAAVAQNFSGVFTVTPFNTNIDTWGASSPSVDFGGPPNSEGGQVIEKPNGDVVLLIMNSTNLLAAVLTAGVWSGPTSILTVALNNYIVGGIGDSTGAIHLVFARHSDNEYFYLRLDNSLTPGTPIDLGSGDTLRASLKLFGTGLAISWSSTDNKSHVSISPSLSSPAFTDYVIDSATGAQQISYSTLAIDRTGKLVNFYVLTDYSGASPYVDHMNMSTFDGASTWSAPILFYDAVTNPPANTSPPIDQFIHTTDAADQFANGQWIVSIALELNVPGEVCAGHMLISPATFTPLTAACPTNGTATLGVPYTAQLQASGGTPPYTWRQIS